MPGPNRLEAVHNRHILPQVREEPKTGRQDEVGDAEEDDAEDSHEEEETEEHEEAPAEVVDALAHLEGPQRVADDGEDGEQGQGGVDLAHHLTALPQPCVIHVVAGLLLRLYPDGPETLNPLALLGRVVVALMRVRLDDTQGEHRHGEQLEGVLQVSPVVDLGKGGILLARLGVGIRLESTQGAFD